MFNTALPAADQTGHDAIYNPSDSKSFVRIPGASFDVSYGDNSSTSGGVGRDTVQIGTITVVGQAVELPSTVSSQFSGDTKSDGIVGLGFSQFGNSISPSPMPTFFENAAPSLVANVFTANLKAGTQGQYEFGTIDASAYRSPLTYTAVNSSGGLWQFDLSQYAVGVDTYGGVVSPAIADTGSSLLMLVRTFQCRFFTFDGYTAYVGSRELSQTLQMPFSFGRTPIFAARKDLSALQLVWFQDFLPDKSDTDSEICVGPIYRRQLLCTSSS